MSVQVYGDSAMKETAVYKYTALNGIVSILLCRRKQMYYLKRLYTTHTTTVSIITTIQLSNMFPAHSAIIRRIKQWR